jgi:hypothetical protein
VISANTFNIKWTFDRTKGGYKPFEVPEEIISIKAADLKNAKLSTFVKVLDNPLRF